MMRVLLSVLAIAAVAVLPLGVLAADAAPPQPQQPPQQAAQPQPSPQPPPQPPAPPPPAAKTWDGARAMKDIAAQVDLGPRSLYASGHERVIGYIERELAKTTTNIAEQKWLYPTPDGKKRQLTNIIAHFGPANTRVLLGTHFDSVARAYRDHYNPKGYMPGANNSASGVALLLETARALKADTALQVGVDMVFFDGEEGALSLGGGDKIWRPLGSPYFADQISTIYPHDKPETGIIFDMVCYKDLKLKAEPFSAHYAEKRMEKFWTIGSGIAPSIFSNEMMAYSIKDDQMALARAGIPTFLVIDFEYEPWFDTTQDTIDKCSPDVLEGLGKTVLSYISSS